MTPDSLIALTLMLILFGFVVTRTFSFPVLEMLLKLGRPGGTVLVLSLVAYAYYKGYFLTTLAGALVSVYLLKDLWLQYPNSDERRLYLDRLKDTARFDPMTSIDLQFANGTVVHDSPNMLHKDKDASPLLVYPPTDRVLKTMSG